MGLEPTLWIWYFRVKLLSPSHTVGSELSDDLKVILSLTELPSHAAGLELIYGVPGSGKTYYASPSHTVGLERYLAWEVGTGKTMSPSHSVGLERTLMSWLTDLANCHHPT